METDPLLRRVRSTALIVCLAMSALAWVVSGRAAPAIAVLAGGLLIAISYWTIGSGVSALVAMLTPASGARNSADRSPGKLRNIAKVVGRYALLAILAYVMIARLRLHPVGLLAGASSVVVAVSIEAVRLLLKKS
jgi:hypothetical protein